MPGRYSETAEESLLHYCTLRPGDWEIEQDYERPTALFGLSRIALT